MAISPIAHAALLHTEMYAGSSCCVSNGRYSQSTGRNSSMHAFAKSPTRAYADCRTSGRASRMHASKVACSLHCVKQAGLRESFHGKTTISWTGKLNSAQRAMRRASG